MSAPLGSWYHRGAETGNPNVPGGYKWWLHCNACAFRLPNGVAGRPLCPDCGYPMNIHSNAAPYTIIWPIEPESYPGREVMDYARSQLRAPLIGR